MSTATRKRLNTTMVVTGSGSVAIHVTGLLLLSMCLMDWSLSEPLPIHEVSLLDVPISKPSFQMYGDTGNINPHRNEMVKKTIREVSPSEHNRPEPTLKHRSSIESPPLEAPSPPKTVKSSAVGQSDEAVTQAIASPASEREFFSQLQEYTDDKDDQITTQNASDAETQIEKRKRSPLAGFSARVRSSIGNQRSFATSEIKELNGTEERLFKNYIANIHAGRIHPRFALTFLESLNKRGSDDPINSWKLRATVEFEILESGAIGEVRVILPSGNPEFDAATVDAIYRASPFPPPPRKTLSWNDRAYMRWSFNRNNRRCGVFNVEPFIIEKPKTYRTYIVGR